MQNNLKLKTWSASKFQSWFTHLPPLLFKRAEALQTTCIHLHNFVHKPFRDNPCVETLCIEIPAIASRSHQRFLWKPLLWTLNFVPFPPEHKVIKSAVESRPIAIRSVTKHLKVQKHSPRLRQHLPKTYHWNPHIYIRKSKHSKLQIRKSKLKQCKAQGRTVGDAKQTQIQDMKGAMFQCRNVKEMQVHQRTWFQQTSAPKTQQQNLQCRFPKTRMVSNTTKTKLDQVTGLVLR